MCMIAFVTTLLLGALGAVTATAAEPINIGSQLELFVDDWLIDEIDARDRLRCSTRGSWAMGSWV